MGNTKYIRLIVVAGLIILLTAFAVPALAQSTTDKEDYSLVPESSAAKEGTAGEEIASGEAVESDDPSVEEDSLIPKGRNRGSQRAVVNQQTNQTNLTDKLKRGGNKTGSPQSANFTQSNSGKTTGIKTAPIRTQNTGISTKDLSKVSIGKQNLSAPISLADKAKPISLSDKSRVTPTSIGSSTASPSSVSPLVKTGPPVSGLIGTSVLKPGLLGGLDKIKPVDIKPIDPGKGNAQGSTTNTQGNVTGGGAGSVTTGGVQSGGGQGSNTQGSTVSTGGGNTVGGIQQSGDNNSVDITQNNTTNVTNVKNVSVGGGGGGGFIGGGGGGGSVDVSPIEYEPEPVVVTRTVAAPQDSCPLVVELNQMGFNYYQAGTYNSAEDVFKRAMEIFDKQACKDKPLKATTLENLAYTFDKLGKYEDAVKYQEQAQLVRRMLK